ncbi:MAG: hypothetical protein OJF55_000741 [Rhodanobacteraceae bacterium]|nr:MAG: hypothetical protein OJF55_000741 [Rhodanobacteraceae bacterium]
MSDDRAAGNHDPSTVSEPDRYSALALVLPHVLGTFRREPALALTVAYLMVSLAGIYFDYGYFQKGFGIPILSLAQIGDYLVAGLQRPMAIALVAATLPLCWLMDLFSTRYHRRDAIRRDRLRALPGRGRWQALHLRYLDWYLDNLWIMHVGYLLVIFVYGWFFVGLYAKYRVNEVKRGGASPVAVRLTGAAADLTAGGTSTWSYLGAVSNYVFLYDHANRQPLVVPVNAVGNLRPVSVLKPAPGSTPVASKP